MYTNDTGQGGKRGEEIGGLKGRRGCDERRFGNKGM